MMRRAADSYAGSIRLRPEAAEAPAALVRPLGAFERLYHLRQQKNTMHFCMVASLPLTDFARRGWIQLFDKSGDPGLRTPDAANALAAASRN